MGLPVINLLVNSQTVRQSDSQTVRPSDRQKDRQTDSNIQMECKRQLTAKKAMRKRVWAAQNVNKEVTMATSQGSPTPGTWHPMFSVENMCTYQDTRAHHEPRGGREGTNQRQKQQSYAEQDHEGKTAMTQLCMSAVIINWPIADLPVNPDH